MISVHKKTDCCGCTSCASVCAHKAISMEPDPMGFLYPKVDVSKCVDCGLCEKVCQFNDNYNRYDNYDEPVAYQYRINDEGQLKRSQSGGAFYAIASNFVKEGCIVYGAAFTADWLVAHQKATTIEELESLRMSKYVQSDMRGVFAEVKDDLKKGYKVLFSGTSCQVAGLKAYIPNKYHTNLYCLDIICHGVPSPKIWEDYIEYLQKKNNSKIVKACFRDKRFGWHGATESFLFENGKEEFRKTSNYLYFSGLSMRESCGECHFTNLQRIGDITVGDQWGISKDSPYEDNKGLSLILVNSVKGSILLKQVSLHTSAEQIPLKDCLQPQLQKPTRMHLNHDKFIRDYNQKGFLYVANHYSDTGWRYKIKKFIKTIKDISRPFIKQ